MRYLFDPFAGADRQVSHLNAGVALAILLRPSVVQRRRDTRSRSHQDNRALSQNSHVAHAQNKGETQMDLPEQIVG
jgi:hypothetical protein